jgi:hypothetical protein
VIVVTLVPHQRVGANTLTLERGYVDGGCTDDTVRLTMGTMSMEMSTKELQALLRTMGLSS